MAPEALDPMAALIDPMAVQPDVVNAQAVDAQLNGPEDLLPSESVVPSEPEPEPSEEVRVEDLMFEDFFPPLKLSETQEEGILNWLIPDLKLCVRSVNTMRPVWAKYRATFLLEYVEKFYPTMGLGAEFASGLVCEKVLEGMDRLRKAVFTPRPMFVVDDKTSSMQEIETIHRLEWFMHTIFEDQLDVQSALGMQAFFEFLLDGSLIVEADQMYEKIPQRDFKTYTSLDTLMMDEPKILDKAQFEEAANKIEAGLPAKLLIEHDILTKNGLQVFIVDKVDHLVPPNVYSDRDLRFRGRRMYLTESDLNLLASDNVNWYDPAKVRKVLDRRSELMLARRMVLSGSDKSGTYAAKEQLYAPDTNNFYYDWRNENEDSLRANKEVLPYKNTFAVYRVVCKYGYKTGNDKKGIIPKFCVFDIEPESRTILRARTYPHFHEKKNYFHFKLGHAPKSYYGFGYAQRLINDDFLESNAIDLYLDGTALATFQPFIAVHPEVNGGYVPFRDGLAPGKIGYVRSIGEFQPFEIPAPPMALIQNLLPILQKRSENKTSVTSLVQGRTESSDPRSPAAKTNMLLREAWVGIDSQIQDWNTTGWNLLADFVWDAYYENLAYQGEAAYDGMIVFSGIAPDLEGTNKITLEELKLKVRWKSQASSEFLNAETRLTKFLQQFQFFSPLIQQLANVAPELYKKYFMRWMRWGAQELQVMGFRYLIPTMQEMEGVGTQGMQAMWQGMMDQLKSGAGPGSMQIGGGAGGNVQ